MFLHAPFPPFPLLQRGPRFSDNLKQTSSYRWNAWYVPARQASNARTPLCLHSDDELFPKAMYEATINQVYTLCSLASVSSVNSGQGEFVDAAVRARIFWYAHIHEGVTTGLRGGRLLLYALSPTAYSLGAFY